MSIKGVTKCSVPECSGSIEKYNNLCKKHRVQGAIMTNGQSTMVMTVWVAERNGEVGFILLDDFALGDLFGGRAVEFKARLIQQGFAKIRKNEWARVKHPASWSGPWLPEYPWEVV
jgi:hypothetical protein